MDIHWLILAVLAVIFIQGQFYRRFGQRRLTYSRSFSVKRCFQGDEIEMREEIANRKPLPLPWLRVESLLHAGMQFQSQTNLEISNGEYVQNHKSFFSLLPYTKITRRHRVVCTRRGAYRINSVALTCGDAVGASSTTRRIQMDEELLVYPKPLPLEELDLPSQSWQGEVAVKRWIVEDPFMISGVREYRYGDSLKGVNWNATARTGKLQVHKRDYTADYKMMILLNIEDHEGMWNTVNETERVEWAIGYAAGMVQYAVSQGMEAGFGTSAYMVDGPKHIVRIEPRSGEDQLEHVFESMAKLNIEPAIPFDQLLEEEAELAGSRMDYYILTAFVSGKIKHQADRLRSSGHHVSFIMLPEEVRGQSPKKGAAAGG
ncbi:DUF58 domain-containing protein [Paenibacillus tarimensis]